MYLIRTWINSKENRGWHGCCFYKMAGVAQALVTNLTARIFPPAIPNFLSDSLNYTGKTFFKN